MEQQNQPKEKDDKKPGIPTLRDAAQKPQLKIKGLKAGQSILERLKQFKKKDLAFILAGLGVLFMAPLAEHFLMSPESGEGAFKQGWNVKPGAGGLGSGGSPFEPGAGGLAPGDLAGGGSDVITPLNARDPSALIMGPGATAQPPATTSAAGGAPAKESSDWKDALSQSAAHAAGAATHAATPLPPLPQLSGGGLRGLGAVAGGGGASYSLPPISASNVPNHGGGGGSLGLAKAAPGYAGARSLTSSGGQDQLKTRAGQAGDAFNRAGSAGSALQTAAGTNMGSGSDFGGAGQGGQGLGQDKAGGQSQNKDSKSEGESLAFLAAKANQEKAIDLKWKLIEKRAMLWPDLRQKMAEELMMTPLKKFTEKFANFIGDSVGGKSSMLTCSYIKEGDTTIPVGAGSFPVDKDKIAKVACSAGGDKDQPQWEPTGTANVFRGCGSSHPVIACLSSGVKPGDTKPSPNNDAPMNVFAQGMPSDQSKSLCDTLQQNIRDAASNGGGGGNPKYVDKQGTMKTYGPQLLDAARKVISVQDAILPPKDSTDNTPYDPSGDCAGAKMFDPDAQSQGPSAGKSMLTRMSNVEKDMQLVFQNMDDFVKQNQALSGTLLDAKGQPVSDGVKSVPSDAPLAQDIKKMAAYVKAKGETKKPDASAVAIAGLLSGANDALGEKGQIGQGWAKLTSQDPSNPLLKADSDVKTLGTLVQDAKGQLANAGWQVWMISRKLDALQPANGSNAAGLQETVRRVTDLIDAMTHKLTDTNGLERRQRNYGDAETGIVPAAEKMLKDDGALGAIHKGASLAIAGTSGNTACSANGCSLSALSGFGQALVQSQDKDIDDQNFLAAIGQSAPAAPAASASSPAAQPAAGQDQGIPPTAKAVSDHLALTLLEKKGGEVVSTLKTGGPSGGVAQN